MRRASCSTSRHNKSCIRRLYTMAKLGSGEQHARSQVNGAGIKSQCSSRAGGGHATTHRNTHKHPDTGQKAEVPYAPPCYALHTLYWTSHFTMWHNMVHVFNLHHSHRTASYSRDCTQFHHSHHVETTIHFSQNEKPTTCFFDRHRRMRILPNPIQCLSLLQ